VADPLQPLLPGAAPRAAAAVVRDLGLRDEASLPADGRPRVVAVMIASADGRAAVGGRSGPLGHPSDRDLLRSVREEADAILVGPGTLRAEGYANLLDPDQRARRRAAGRAALPDVATISRSLDVPSEVGLFAEADAVVRVYTARAGAVAARGATVHVHAMADPSPRAALQHLRAEAGVRAVACEGGPTLLRALVADGCLDDLLLTLAPLLAAGEEVRPLEGPPLVPPAGLALEQVLRAGDHLVLHYRPRR
jgi:riboflavin biosynthesis pyrimidine reductase